ncbi:MAG: HAMP domain-containing sensor histidine kinase [Acutalibacteraceae bacterium]|nr:HAMP domain-containing sensor histidine kinase [Acutalibacteraceae bacterium]
MNKKLKKQKRRLFAGIAIALFLLSLSVCLAFSIMIYHNEQASLYSEAERNFEGYLGSTVNAVQKKNSLNYFLNLEYDDNVYMFVIDDTTGEVIAERKNAQPFLHLDYDKEIQHIGIIDYENFRESMTDEQYNKISEYLLAEDKEYVLLCAEYFYYDDDAEIIPKVVEVTEVKQTAEDIYENIAMVESFELNPTYNESANYYKVENGEDRYIAKEYIEEEFFLGEYNRENLIEYTVGFDEFGLDFSGASIYYTDWFEFIFVNTEEFYKDEQYICTATFAQKINVLESCKKDIIMMNLYIMLLFVITGIILGVVMWRNLKKQIEQENRLRTVTNAMAHQLKTPLFIIGGYSENLAENVNTEKREHYAQVIKEQTISMNEMVCKMLDYSKLDSDNFTLNIEKFELSTLLKEIADCYSLDEAQVDCEADFYIEADKKLIRMAIENLIDNAVKYSEDPGKVSVSLKNNEFTVQNPFREVSKQELKDMWKPYYRTTEKEKADGHGLGLAVVKNIFDLHKFKYSAKYADGNMIFSFSVSAENR